MATLLRIYLDTSVFSAYYDQRTPERQQQTREFWERRAGFDLATSEIARHELAATPDPVRRAELEALLHGTAVHAVTPEMEHLAVAYVDSGAFAPTMLDDARHVAVAVVTRQDVLLSWNFQHLVNRRRRAQVNQVNAFRGLPAIEILSPPEL